MAGTSLLALIDDIASILDDVATMTKVATKKTVGVLGDDLALNAQQVVGVRPDRELPVVLAVAAGSIKNKLILIPAALLISALLPWMVTPLLMLGGAYLCYEGFEKLTHKLTHGKAEVEADRRKTAEALADDNVEMVSFEKEKIGGAIRTDFILSAEIIVITLGIVTTASFGTQVAVLLGIGLLMTVGVYGLVAGIVKLDDWGLYLNRKSGAGLLTKVKRGLGKYVLLTAPYFMKGLSIAGTVAMFMVGGGILVHGLFWVEGIVHTLEQISAALPILFDATFGLLVGAVVLVALNLGARAWAEVNSKP